MATLINNGWLYLSDGTDEMKLACREIKWDAMREPEIIHEVGGWSYGYDLDIDYLIIKVSGILFKTSADHVIFETKLRSWQKSGVINLKVQRKVAGDFEPLDGTYTQIQVLAQKGWQDIQKIANEDGEVYEIGKIAFEEAGQRS